MKNAIAEWFWNVLFGLWTRLILNPYISVRRRLFEDKGFVRTYRLQKRLERIRWAIFRRWEKHYLALPREVRRRRAEKSEYYDQR